MLDNQLKTITIHSSEDRPNVPKKKPFIRSFSAKVVQRIFFFIKRKAIIKINIIWN